MCKYRLHCQHLIEQELPILEGINSVTVVGSTPGGNGDVSDVSDDGDDTDGNTTNDPTVINPLIFQLLLSKLQLLMTITVTEKLMWR